MLIWTSQVPSMLIKAHLEVNQGCMVSFCDNLGYNRDSQWATKRLPGSRGFLAIGLFLSYMGLIMVHWRCPTGLKRHHRGSLKLIIVHQIWNSRVYRELKAVYYDLIIFSSQFSSQIQPSLFSVLSTVHSHLFKEEIIQLLRWYLLAKT